MEQPSTKLQKPLSVALQPNTKGEISVYNDAPLEARTLVANVDKIKKTFPNLPAGFYEILSSRLKFHQFTNRRFIDSVNNVIDHCRFQTPTVAEFVSWDRKIKLYDYKEVLQMNDRDYKGVAFKYFKRIKSSCKKQMYAHVDDIRDHGLEVVMNAE